METLIEHLHEIFGSIIKISYQASVLICLIILLQLLFRKKYGPRWHYWLWLLLLLRMIIPWTPASSVSMFQIMIGAENLEHEFLLTDPELEATDARRDGRVWSVWDVVMSRAGPRLVNGLEELQMLIHMELSSGPSSS